MKYFNINKMFLIFVLFVIILATGIYFFRKNNSYQEGMLNIGILAPMTGPMKDIIKIGNKNQPIRDKKTLNQSWEVLKNNFIMGRLRTSSHIQRCKMKAGKISIPISYPVKYKCPVADMNMLLYRQIPILLDHYYDHNRLLTNDLRSMNMKLQGNFIEKLQFFLYKWKNFEKKNRDWINENQQFCKIFAVFNQIFKQSAPPYNNIQYNTDVSATNYTSLSQLPTKGDYFFIDAKNKKVSIQTYFKSNKLTKQLLALKNIINYAFIPCCNAFKPLETSLDMANKETKSGLLQIISDFSVNASFNTVYQYIRTYAATPPTLSSRLPTNYATLSPERKKIVDARRQKKYELKLKKYNFLKTIDQTLTLIRKRQYYDLTKITCAPIASKATESVTMRSRS